jgi:hypothetical protein
MVTAADGTTWPAPSEADLRAIATRRGKFWANGFRPLPVLSHTDPDRKTASKAPLGKDWPVRARKTPPEVVQFDRAAPHAANTGILCDGLRAVDIDLDDLELGKQVFELAREMLGDTITRRRDHTGRRCMLYRAAEGEPGKVVLQGEGGKVELLGRGQQVVVDGIHYPSHSPLYWVPSGPDGVARDDLPAVTEAQVQEFLRAAAPLIGATPPESPKAKSTNGGAGAPISTADLSVDLQLLADALAAIPTEGTDYHGWIKIGLALYRATEGAAVGMALWDGWSHNSPEYDADGLATKWASFGGDADRQVNAGTIFYLAQQAGWKFPAPRPDPGLLAAEEAAAGEDAARHVRPDPRPGDDQEVGEDQGEGAASPDPDEGHMLPHVDWQFADAHDDAGEPLPERDWIVPDWIPGEQATALYGPAGSNKTDFLLQLAIARAFGLPFLGRQIDQGTVFGLFCEDTLAELRRRIRRTCDRYGRRPCDLPPGQFRFASLVGVVNPEFVTFDAAGLVQFERPLLRFDRALEHSGASLALLDTGADFFGGNEVARRQVGAFMRTLEAISIRRKTAVVFTAHPSVRGLDNGVFDSGSTAWGGKTRSRLSLHDPAAGDEDAEDRKDRAAKGLPLAPSDKRRLIRQKSNYAPPGEALDLVCRNGFFTTAALDPGKAGGRGAAHDRLVDEKALELIGKIIAEGGHVNDSRASGNSMRC